MYHNFDIFYNLYFHIIFFFHNYFQKNYVKLYKICTKIIYINYSLYIILIYVYVIYLLDLVFFFLDNLNFLVLLLLPPVELANASAVPKF